MPDSQTHAVGMWCGVRGEESGETGPRESLPRVEGFAGWVLVELGKVTLLCGVEALRMLGFGPLCS